LAFPLQFVGQRPTLFAQELKAVLLLAQVLHAVLGQPHNPPHTPEDEDADDEGRGAHEERTDAHDKENAARACFRHHPQHPLGYPRPSFVPNVSHVVA
jgi:hypothetical protein